MSATNSTSMRDALYEAPGPHTRRRIRFWTAISLVLVAVGIGLIVRRFYVTGQPPAPLASLYPPNNVGLPWQGLLPNHRGFSPWQALLPSCWAFSSCWGA